MKTRINWIKCLLKRLKPYTVLHVSDERDNYLYSVLCLYKGVSGKCDNFIRIKFNRNDCEIEGDIGKIIEDDIFYEETAGQ